MAEKIVSHKDLYVYRHAFAAAVRIHTLTRTFPREEQYSLTDQVRRSSRSVCANLAEAWRKRRYQGSFISKLDDAEGEAAETQVWLELAVEFGYLSSEEYNELVCQYEGVLRTIVGMINHPESWVLKTR